MNKVIRTITGPAQVTALAKYLHDHFNDKQFPLAVTIERKRPRRNNDQNAKWHAMVGEISQFTGDDAKSVKADLKQLFLPQVKGLRDVMRPKNTSDLTTMEFADLIEQTQRLGADLGVVFSE